MRSLDKLSLSILLTEGNFSCLKAARSLESVSHDHLTRLYQHDVEFKACLTPLEQLPQPGYLVVDDSVVAKPYAKEIEGLSYTWSGNDGKVVMGMSVFLAVWQSQGQLYLVQVELPGEHTKHKLLQTLLAQMKQAKLQPECIYFDNWYCSSETLNQIENLGWSYVSRLKGNRLFEGSSVEKHRFWGAMGKMGQLKGVKHRVQVVKHEDRFLVTNVLTPKTTHQLAKQYEKRWVIETVFRALKSVHHLEKCHCRTLKAQFNHLLAALKAYDWLKNFLPHLGPELAQREFIHQYKNKILNYHKLLGLTA